MPPSSVVIECAQTTPTLLCSALQTSMLYRWISPSSPPAPSTRNSSWERLSAAAEDATTQTKVAARERIEAPSLLPSLRAFLLNSVAMPGLPWLVHVSRPIGVTLLILEFGQQPFVATAVAECMRPVCLRPMIGRVWALFRSCSTFNGGCSTSNNQLCVAAVRATPVARSAVISLV